MPTSATGISTASGRRIRAHSAAGAARGFTLLEVLVVTVIVGIVVSASVLALSAGGSDRELDREGNRLLALLQLAAEESVLQGREFALEFFDGGYRFHAYRPAAASVPGRVQGQWTPLDHDRQFRTRTLPSGLNLTLFLDGRPVTLPQAAQASPRPQILLSSSGEMTPFRVELARTARTSVQLTGDAAGRLQLEWLGE